MKLLSVRKDFPIFERRIQGKELIYLDSAATTQKPLSVIDTMYRFYTQEYGTVHRAVYQLATESTKKYSQVREQVSRFLGSASSDEIIFTRGTTDAINLVANSFGKAFIQENDEVIISEMEHHSNIVPWQLLCEERKAVLKVVPINERAELNIEAFRLLCTVKTKLVSFAHIANSTGTLNPIEEIIEIAHRKGAKVFIDGAQSAAHLPINVQALDVDFYAFSGHKTYGPTGIGILFGKKELLEKMPPYQGGGDMIEQVTFEKTRFQPPPLRFEAGTPMIAEVIGLGAALDYINEIGLLEISSWEQALLQYATEKIQLIKGLTIIGTAAKKGPIISFIVEGIHHLDLGTLLDLDGIALRTGHHCAQPLMKRFGISGTSRISFGIYNTFEDIDRFIEALQKAIAILK